MRRLLLVPTFAFTLASTTFTLQQDGVIRESPALAALERDLAGGRRSAGQAFWTRVEQEGSPIVEKTEDAALVLATFAWRDRGDTAAVILNARVNSYDPVTDPRNRFQRLAGTDIWYLSHRFPRDAEFLYQLFVNPPTVSDARVAQRSLRPDPLSHHPYPESTDPLFDPSQPWRNGSIARMPGVSDNPWLARKSSVPSGSLRESAVKSAWLTLANPRTVWVYTSPGASVSDANVLILLDGGTTYQSRIPATTILDNLFAAKKIGPTVAIFVDNGGEARAFDMTFNDAFVKFLADELLPWVAREYQLTPAAARTALGGDSLCGLIGAYAALRRPDVFGKVLSQSGAFQMSNPRDSDRAEPEWLARQFAFSRPSPTFFYLDVGRMEDRIEGNDGTTLLASNRHLRDVLVAKGYRIHYTEVYADHDPVHWERTLPEALIAMFGT